MSITTNFFRSYTFAQAKNTTTSLVINSREGKNTVDRIMKSERLSDRQAKFLILRPPKALLSRTRNGKVYIKEHGVYLRVHLVEDSPSVLSLGRRGRELGYSYSWPSGETSRLPKDKKVTERIAPWLH